MAQSALLTVMIGAARKAARGIQRDFGEVENLQVSRKGPGDFVTSADKRTEKVLHDELSKARPEYGFLGEEGGEIRGSDPDHRWIIDPIDGTTNFIHGLPLLAISIALERKGEPVAGLIYNPIMDELYTAEKGRGAYLNERRRLRVSAREDLADALVTCGLPHRRGEAARRYLREQEALTGKVAGLRRTGSACLDLAFVAAGRFDAFWERELHPWDLAAGILLIRESGGRTGDIDGNGDPLQTGAILATNSHLHAAMERCLRSP